VKKASAMPLPFDPADLLGYALRDYFVNGTDVPVKVWINGRRDEDLMPSLFFRNYRHMRAWDRQALRMAKGSVLDAGAGSGGHSLILQGRGMDVTAVERSPASCEVMRLRGVQRVIQENLFDLRGIPFDTILMLMNGLGMAGTEKETLKLFRHLRKMLTKGGQIIGDSTDILYSRMDSLSGFPPGNTYYGEVEFRLEYCGVKGTPFRWLYLDPSLLAELSDKAGLHCEIVQRSKDFHYLARLTA
jgi:SAM-dependent methyltransferase